MMSGHDPNPIFFNNEKIKTGRPEYSLTPPPSPSDNIAFLPYSPPPPPSPNTPPPLSKWTPYVYHLLCLYVQQHPPPEM